MTATREPSPRPTPPPARGRPLVLLLAVHLSASAVACASSAGPPPNKRPWRPPHKPGDSYAKARQCTCNVCEPRDCCHELDREPDVVDPNCANGYDFSKCEMAVQSCESNCYPHKWWTTVDVGCEASRPERCCHAEASF